MMSRRRREKRREMVGVRRAYQRAVQGAVSQRSTREGYGARWVHPMGEPANRTTKDQRRREEQGNTKNYYR
jgi:hypothetical protein